MEIGEVLVEDVADVEDVEGATFHPIMAIASMPVAVATSHVVEVHDDDKEAVYEITCPTDSEDRHSPATLPG